MTTKKELENLLSKAYDALCGVASEQGEEGLGRYCDPSLLGEIAESLGLGGDGAYHVVEYTSRLNGRPERKWGVCTDPKNPDKTWVLTGLSSAEEAVEVVRSVDPDAEVKVAA